MPITSQAEYQAALAAANDLGNVQRAKERARIEAEWAQYQATQQAALTAAQIAAERAQLAELDNVARARAAATLNLQVQAQSAVQSGITLTGDTRRDQINLKVAELLKLNPAVNLPDTTSLTDEQFFNEWVKLGGLTEVLQNVSGGQGSRVLSQAIDEEATAQANLDRAGGVARYRKIEQELYTPQRAKVLEVVQLIERDAMKTFKRQSWQNLAKMVALVATVGYAAGGTGAASASGGGAATTGSAVATTEVTKDIVVAGVNTGFSTGSAALNTVIGQTATGAVSGAVVGAATPGGSGSKGAEAGAKKGATSAATGEAKALMPDVSIPLEFDYQYGIPGLEKIDIGIPKSSYQPILRGIIDNALVGAQTPNKTPVPSQSVEVDFGDNGEKAKPDWKVFAGFGMAAIGLLVGVLR